MVVMAVEVGDAATWGSTLVALLVAVTAWLQGRKAKADQEEQARVQREAIDLAHRQTEAGERRAFAVEQMLGQLIATHGLRPSAPPQPRPSSVEWMLERRGKHVYLLRNVGNDTATGVRVDPSGMPSIASNLPEDAIVRPGESLDFLMAASLATPLPREICVSWNLGGDPVAVPVPN
ncbi:MULTISPECIES: hypothetical protein [unclassified Streptomyces]|uniref:hypothetical protein n=1 Tax=unclassified Streptomyces TaxID=2593676 RepID=UPI00131A2936|nr:MULTISPECIES: hypothetical protein [unclassified Streptomyces]MYX34380.1 hypothetical protein [Streptomyces sp. SID8377]